MVNTRDISVACCSYEMTVIDLISVTISVAEVAIVESSRLAELSCTRAVSLVMRVVVLSAMLSQSLSNWSKQTKETEEEEASKVEEMAEATSSMPAQLARLMARVLSAASTFSASVASSGAVATTRPLEAIREDVPLETVPLAVTSRLDKVATN